MASGGGLLPIYQQPKYINGVPMSTVGRRTLRLREKYILVLVVSIFAFVCFGAIFFMPDIRDAQIGPVDIGDIFMPRLPAGGVQNRHGRGGLRDPNELNDERVFRAIIDWPHSQSLPAALTGQLVDSDGSVRQWNDTVKDGRLVNIPSNTSQMDNVTRERQETVKQVVFTIHLSCFVF